MKKLSHEDFLKKFKLIDNTNEYELLDEYKNRRTKILIKHKICNNTFLIRPDQFTVNHNKCPYCNQKHKKNTIEFISLVSNLSYGINYKILGKYVDMLTPIKALYIPLNKEIEIIPKLFLNGKQPKSLNLSQNHRKTSNEFKNIINKTLNGSEFKLLSKYGNNNKDKVEIQHLKCNNNFLIRPNDFIKNNFCACPVCSKSSGEVLIKNTLEKNNIDFIMEYSYDDLKDTQKLRFDFYLIKFNILIEYDGEQHFYNSFKNSNEKFDKIIYHDYLKNYYCIKHKINLIRLPYWEFKNIEKIINSLSDTLKQQKDLNNWKINNLPWQSKINSYLFIKNNQKIKKLK